MKPGDPESPSAPQHETMLPPPSGINEYTFPVAGAAEETLSFPITTMPPSVGFTLPERAVLKGVSAGMSNAEIAADRGCSRRTVLNVLRRICSKMNLPNREELERHLTAGVGRVAVLDLRASNSLGGLAREKSL